MVYIDASHRHPWYPHNTTQGICGERYGNSMPFASTSFGLPHTCFEDVILVPLASWIFLIIFALSFLRRGGSGPARTLHRIRYRSGKPGWSGRWSKTATGLSILYSFLVAATLLMNVLEVVRLRLAARGAGLLYFSLIVLLLVLVYMHIPLPYKQRLPLRVAFFTFFTLSLVFTSVKLATLEKLANIEPRTGTEYLNSDQRIDVETYLGLYAVEFLVESYRLLQLIRRSLEPEQSEQQEKREGQAADCDAEREGASGED
ncbi:hypothetical protein CONPUDRAFT_73774 [Coniophora puteana RWD-64-598 SS2]|uniref:Uncharacterized protein n=1 Tax=Coniophora puteana (strain RWD-64-598) TaxID=741705 RepID=A0A5M3MNH5_CONPW|nr:uncharacterized protein CONPUDRAFT_73774 [Coniophora puteana RWD-64-598 SS2]EIW80712.1 hypothetical protein CONPUDRAFT_73774 [Coniophora puteana RWD-64-598 SS2]